MKIGNYVAKISGSRQAVGLLLPVPQGKQVYADINNFYIEYYFTDECLAQHTPEGYGLEFEQPVIEQRIVGLPGAPVLGQQLSTSLETRRIVGGKVVFAERVVPHLPPEAFAEFSLIYDAVNTVLEHLHQE